MATFTTRLALTKPAGSEPRSVTPINTNSDLIDKFTPCILVNDGVTPPTGDLYDGALVKERTSGIIWEARKNGGGTFDKVYVQYPHGLRVDSNQVTPTASGTPITYTLLSGTLALLKNASSSNLDGSGRWVAPVKGLYLIHIQIGWEPNATGYRVCSHELNGVVQSGDNDQVTANAVNGTNTRLGLTLTKIVQANETYRPASFHNAGTNLVTRAYFQVTMIQPIQ